MSHLVTGSMKGTPHLGGTRWGPELCLVLLYLFLKSLIIKKSLIIVVGTWAQISWHVCGQFYGADCVPPPCCGSGD